MKSRITYCAIPQQGDIVLVKRFSLAGWLIGSAFRCDSPVRWISGSRPSNHDGIIGFSADGIPCVYEALTSGFVATPLSAYADECEAGKCEIKIVRKAGGLRPRQMLDANIWLNEHLGTEYDYRSYLSHIWRMVLRLPAIWNSNSKSKFYCTEAVQQLWSFLGEVTLAPYYLIAPIHIEREFAAGRFETIADCVPLE